ncbi:MAG TPA: helicase C-terminal domain-containing protein, partial [Candidatus Krumholzibacterium sp.]|nr:helicase C-terminal domain-containing protein [Candidatus Krumholzibacterium sp.]
GSCPGLEEILSRIPAVLGESREGQSEMARVVMESLEAGETALIEAATGTGKSLAYLVPAVIRAKGSGARTVISTHTKNLQDQLVTKEIPNIEKLFGETIPAARLLGRESYICSRRLVSRVTRMAEEDPAAAFRASVCAALCRDGIAGMLGADSGISRPSSVSAPPRCRMKGCSAGDSCPLVAARDRARKAGIVFVNHALALTDYIQGGAIIGPREGMILDEAHHLEDSVMDNLSIRVSTADVERIFEELSPLGLAEKRWKYMAGELEAVEPGTDWRRLIARAAEAATRLEEGVKAFFGSLTSQYSGRQDLRGARTRYFDGGEAFADLREELSDIAIYIKLLKDSLKPVTEPSLPPAAEVMQSEVEYALDELAEFGERLDYLSGARDEESVFWIEWSAAGRAFALCGSPLDVGRRFADFLQDSCDSAVLTSATLAQGGSFEYTRSRLGLDLPGASTRELIVGSPFSLEENCRIVLQTDLGDPNGSGFAAAVAGVTASLSRETGRSILVLLTSYRLCNEVARSLEDQRLEGPVLIQEGRSGREALATRFRSSENPVLLGVASFWEGVDFPGDELELLIIPK